MARPAHRPSRRAAVVDAAIGLFATSPPDAITVADIAAAADMTPAAVYYHFPSKEQILLEGLRGFVKELLDDVRRALPRRSDGPWARVWIVHTLDWLERRGPAASVFFAHSSGLDLTIEALRRETRIELVVLFSRAVRVVNERPPAPAQVGVMAVGLLSVMETAAASWLDQDAVFRCLGRRRFLDEVGRLAERVVAG